nr:hypothetical protein [Janibacter melonis]
MQRIGPADDAEQELAVVAEDARHPGPTGEDDVRHVPILPLRPADGIRR